MIIVSAFIIWSLIQGILELLASYLHDPALAYALLPHNPFNFGPPLQPPSLKYPFGTNGEGAGYIIENPVLNTL